MHPKDLEIKYQIGFNNMDFFFHKTSFFFIFSFCCETFFL